MQYRGRTLRHELKFHLGMKEYGVLRSRLNHVLPRDRFQPGAEGYFIRSLYFDDVYNSALYEKNAGVAHRRKYRIRVYNLCSDVIKLECKRKFGEYISKESVPIALDEYRAILAGDVAFLRDATGLRQEFYRQVQDRGLRPRVIVDYDREAYAGEASGVRVTFDRNLRVGYNGCDVFDRNLLTYSVDEPGTVILEIKFNEFLPDPIGMLLKGCASQYRTAISKYVLCRTSKGNIY